MSNYVITNIRLPEEDYFRLKEEAAKKRTSLSAVIREKVSMKKATENYAQKLLTLKTGWFSDKEYKENRVKVTKRLGKSVLATTQTLSMLL